MKGLRTFSAILALTATVGLSVTTLAADNVLVIERNPSGNYCHMKFPAIREDTLNWDRPVLKPSNTGDIIDFYGPCDHDPLGRQEARDQKRQMSSANVDD